MESRQNETPQNENLLEHEDTCTEAPALASVQSLPGRVKALTSRNPVVVNIFNDPQVFIVYCAEKALTKEVIELIEKEAADSYQIIYHFSRTSLRM